MARIQRLHHYGKKSTTREEWHRVIREAREDFNASAMTGRRITDDDVSYGDLPEPYRSELQYARPDYIVYSYATPIAWHDSVTDKWHVPDVNYSLTTTGHQNTVSMAIDTWDPEDDKYPHGGRWLHDYVTGPHVNLRTGKGKSPYCERAGW